MFKRIYDKLNCLDILFHKAKAISPSPPDQLCSLYSQRNVLYLGRNSYTNPVQPAWFFVLEDK
jgi:hypothetical protein